MIRKILITVILSVFTVCTFAQFYKYALNLETGKKYNVTMTSKGVSKMTHTTKEYSQAFGVLLSQIENTFEAPVETSIYQLVEIQEATDKGFKVAVTTTRIVSTTTMLGQTVTVDSDNEAERDGLASQLGTTTFEVSGEGRIIEGSLEKSQGGEDKDANATDAMLRSLGLKDDVTPVFNLFSENLDLTPGDHFTENQNDVETVYTLKSLENDVAAFTSSGSGSLERKISLPNGEGEIKTNTKTSGEVLVDLNTGMLIKKTVTSEGTGTMTIPESPMTSGSLLLNDSSKMVTMPVTTTLTTTITVTEE